MTTSSSWEYARTSRLMDFDSARALVNRSGSIAGHSYPVRSYGHAMSGPRLRAGGGITEQAHNSMARRIGPSYNTMLFTCNCQLRCLFLMHSPNISTQPSCMPRSLTCKHARTMRLAPAASRTSHRYVDRNRSYREVLWSKSV